MELRHTVRTALVLSKNFCVWPDGYTIHVHDCEGRQMNIDTLDFRSDLRSWLNGSSEQITQTKDQRPA